jgi:putative transposase
MREAIMQYGCPEIFNTDQGCQFTSLEYTGLLKDQGIQIGMDGRACWRDNVFVERLWRSLKYEEVYLHAYETVRNAPDGVARYLTFYNEIRPHRALEGRTLDRVDWEKTGLHGPPPRRPHSSGTTYELAEPV